MRVASLLILALGVAACTPPYGGPHCSALTTNTPLSSIPEFDPARLGPAEDTTFTFTEPFIAGTEEIACCARNPFFSSPRCATQVDCEAYLKTLRQISLNGKYANEKCGPKGGVAQNCILYVDQQDRIAGVRTFCLD